MLEKYPVELKLVHKFIPAHPFSLKAASAALAAEEQGKFWEFHDKLFEYQKDLNDEKLIEIAKMLHLNLDRFTKKMRDPALAHLINRDYDEAKELGVTATPWIYIDGWHPTERSLPDLVDAIDKELKK